MQHLGWTNFPLFKLIDGSDWAEFPHIDVTCIATEFPKLDYILDPKRRGFPLGRDRDLGSRYPEVGKAQPLSAKIKTLEGWKLMGDLQIGDVLASIDGEDSVVEAIYPQGFRRVWKVIFSDGRSTRCCGEHLWKVTKNHAAWRRRDEEYDVINTYELREALRFPSNRKKFSIPVVSGDFGTDSLNCFESSSGRSAITAGPSSIANITVGSKPCGPRDEHSETAIERIGGDLRFERRADRSAKG